MPRELITGRGAPGKNEQIGEKKKVDIAHAAGCAAAENPAARCCAVVFSSNNDRST
jgi:hypothetical protein